MVRRADGGVVYRSAFRRGRQMGALCVMPSSRPELPEPRPQQPISVGSGCPWGKRAVVARSPSSCVWEVWDALPKVLCCHCRVLWERPHSAEGDRTTPRQNALAHVSSNEFTVWVLVFVVFNVTVMSVWCLFFISWAKQLHWEPWTREIHSLRTSDDGQTFCQSTLN